MPRRLGLLALALASSTVVIVEPVFASPPTEGPVEGPVEGPALPPPEEPPSEPSGEDPSDEDPSGETASDPIVQPPPPSITPGFGGAGGIELATPVSELGTEPPPSTPGSQREEIGKAPASGGSFLAGGLWLLPLATAGTTVLVLNNRANSYPPYTGEAGIITAGVGLGLIGAAMLGTGVYRQVKLARWAKRHRVIALPQGSGLVTSGTLAVLFGLVELIAGARAGSTLDMAIGGVLLASAPVQLAIGARFAARYRRTDGWRRTQWTLTPGGFRMQF
jgi:hypothetical protein